MTLLRRLLDWLAPPRKVPLTVEGCFAARGFQDCIVWGHIGRTWFCARGGGTVWRFAPQGERCPDLATDGVRRAVCARPRDEQRALDDDREQMQLALQRATRRGRG